MDKISKIVYINLDSRPERNSRVLSHLSEYFPSDKIFRYPADHFSNGHVGCGLSHINVLQHAIDEQLENILIVEDDFYFLADKDVIDKKLSHLFTNFPKFNICQFGVNLLKSRQLDDTISQVVDGQTTSCYLVQSHFFKTLQDCFVEAVQNLASTNNNNKYAIDQWWKRLQDENFLTFTEKIGRQRDGWSDTEKRFVTYNC